MWVIDWLRVSDWASQPVSQQESEQGRDEGCSTAFLGHQGPYKPYNYNLYVEIIIIPHIDSTQFTDDNKLCHKWGQYTPILIITHIIQKYPIKIFILQSCATQVGILQENFIPEEFRHHFAHQSVMVLMVS